MAGFVSPQGLSAQNYDFVPGEIIVKLKTAPRYLFKAGAGNRVSFGVVSLDSLNQQFQVREISAALSTRNPSPDAIPGHPSTHLYKLTFDQTSDLRVIQDAYSVNPNVEYVQPNYLHHIDSVPNDPLLQDQIALQVIRAAPAWEIQTASRDVIVGVIDTGVNYLHEDLRDAMWVNLGEDLNGNGKADFSDLNGLDDDGNGFVDDIRGWDFTDAPIFPDGGDYIIPDNDPLDEHGHGTSVAGLIGATGNNGTGIAGLAYGCRIMNLRAGTSLGVLEEDDVASAVLYAVENGAHVINMSFGDVVASPLLKDVIQFAVARNCVIVASAGNSSTDELHYPSGLSETISVGATTNDDNLATFSNYGSSVDVVAPGANLLTTNHNGLYAHFSGTSASAPLVSALSALILSKIPELSPESVKGLLLSSSVDLGTRGWDNFFASGRIDALMAMESPYYSIARIDKPRLDEGFPGGTTAINVTATGTFMRGFSLAIGEGETPTYWQELYAETNRQAIDAHVADLNIEILDDTVYTLKLTVTDNSGRAIEDRVRIFVDRTPPEITRVRLTPMLDADRPSLLLEFETDDVCVAALQYRPVGSAVDFEELRLRYQSDSHRVHLTQDLLPGRNEFFIKATNRAGQAGSFDNSGKLLVVDLVRPAISGLAVERLAEILPSAFVLGKPADFDRDGNSEIIVSRYDAQFNFGALSILEMQGGLFEEVFATGQPFIPRDWGDSDGDGLAEILVGFGAESVIFEATSFNSFPTTIVWANSNNAWASRFADLDADGAGELIIRMDKLFTVWETTGNNQYALIDSFPNPTPGGNNVGVPHSEIADFDGDGRLEILLGDFDGDIYLYENIADNRYEFTWQDRMPLIDTIDFLSQGDYDGDGIHEFIVGCHSDPNLNTESTFESRHWLFRIYKADGDNSFAPVWEQAFFGFQSPADFDSGVSSGNIDDDPNAEIFIHVFPDLYVVDYVEQTADYQVIWHTSPVRTNTVLTHDFDRNGINEYYFNNGLDIAGRQLITGFGGPSAPTAFKATILDSEQVELNWQPAHSPNGFQLYRGTSPESILPFQRTDAPLYLDDTVSAGTTYWYRITAIDSALVPVESLPSQRVQVKPGPRPFLANAEFAAPNNIVVAFSKAMNNTIKNPNNFWISELNLPPTTAIPHRSKREVLLWFPGDPAPGTYSLSVRNVFDSNGIPIDTSRNSTTFDVLAQFKAPYLVNATLMDNSTLRLEFSEPMDIVSASDVESYRVEPDIQVVSAQLSTADSRFVLLSISSKSPLGPFGTDYFITVREVRSQNGVAIRFGEGDSLVLQFTRPDLSHVFAFPNPYRGFSVQNHVTIAGLTSEATIRIMDVSGRLVRTLVETDGDGGVQWDLQAEDGTTVPSGIYIFYVVSEDQKAMGKLAIMR